MKASELLTLALANYKIESYMCHEIQHIAGKYSKCEASLFLDDKIQSLLAPHSTIVLHNLLRNTSKKYKAYDKRYGHRSNACYKMRVAFWQDMIAELKAEGL